MLRSYFMVYASILYVHVYAQCNHFPVITMGTSDKGTHSVSIYPFKAQLKNHFSGYLLNKNSCVWWHTDCDYDSMFIFSFFFINSSETNRKPL